MNIKLTIAAAALALSAPAFAAYEISDTAKIAYGDLDLTTDSGIAHLERRMLRAAEQVCGYVPPRGLADQQRTAACHEGVMAQAKAVIQPVLAAGRTNGRLAQSMVVRAR